MSVNCPDPNISCHMVLCEHKHACVYTLEDNAEEKKSREKEMQRNLVTGKTSPKSLEYLLLNSRIIRERHQTLGHPVADYGKPKMWSAPWSFNIL